jgi:hypothetical protein
MNPQAVPSQVASALVGGLHGVQEAPQLARAVLETQLPLQSCSPAGHIPSQDRSAGMQAPKQSLLPEGHSAPQRMPSQVAVPPVGASHFVQAVPQVSMSRLRTQPSPQRW